MELIKWLASTVITLVVVGAGAVLAFSVASFMFTVQIFMLFAMVVAGLVISIKEYFFNSKD